MVRPVGPGSSMTVHFSAMIKNKQNARVYIEKIMALVRRRINLIYRFPPFSTAVFFNGLREKKLHVLNICDLKQPRL